MKSTLLLALFVFVLAFVAGCKAPDSNVGKDSTNKLEKKSGGTDE